MSVIKQRIKSLIEFLHLGKTVDYLRFKKEYLSQKDNIRSFLKTMPGEAFPEPFMVYETFRLDYERYWHSGAEDARWIIDHITPFKALSGKRILDWGCGPARVIRHFPGILPDAVLWGTDYNERYVAWCDAHIPGITFRKNNLNPPLPVAAESLDLVYSISIFTHLSEQSHYEWIEEMHRVLDKDGILFFTSHGDITQRNLLKQELEVYKKGDIVVRGNVTEGNRMYCAYHPVPFIHQLLNGKFKVLKHVPGQEQSWGLEQDVWIVQKLSEK